MSPRTPWRRRAGDALHAIGCLAIPGVGIALLLVVALLLEAPLGWIAGTLLLLWWIGVIP